MRRFLPKFSLGKMLQQSDACHSLDWWRMKDSYGLATEQASIPQIAQSPICPRCKLCPESTIHVLLWCGLAQEVWKKRTSSGQQIIDTRISGSDKSVNTVAYKLATMGFTKGNTMFWVEEVPEDILEAVNRDMPL
ncbi:hypothetical protein Gotri_008223 [Gossypium trilobum]|uniref:Reverse transcriptase zinc-binding domain-containing protein n=1 Tax=Gossypium trilobum TaxID=34281 RepID=A0A7J9EJ83_9ROSI|nr:hypothetical protein [Gossypium trilobum]